MNPGETHAVGGEEKLAVRRKRADGVVVQDQQILSILSHHPVSGHGSLARLFLGAGDTSPGQQGQYVTQLNVPRTRGEGATV